MLAHLLTMSVILFYFFGVLWDSCCFVENIQKKSPNVSEAEVNIIIQYCQTKNFPKKGIFLDALHEPEGLVSTI